MINKILSFSIFMLVATFAVDASALCVSGSASSTSSGSTYDCLSNGYDGPNPAANEAGCYYDCTLYTGVDGTYDDDTDSGDGDTFVYSGDVTGAWDGSNQVTHCRYNCALHSETTSYGSVNYSSSGLVTSLDSCVFSCSTMDGSCSGGSVTDEASCTCPCTDDSDCSGSDHCCDGSCQYETCSGYPSYYDNCEGPLAVADGGEGVCESSYGSWVTVNGDTVPASHWFDMTSSGSGVPTLPWLYYDEIVDDGCNNAGGCTTTVQHQCLCRSGWDPVTHGYSGSEEGENCHLPWDGSGDVLDCPTDYPGSTDY